MDNGRFAGYLRGAPSLEDLHAIVNSRLQVMAGPRYIVKECFYSQQFMNFKIVAAKITDRKEYLAKITIDEVAFHDASNMQNLVEYVIEKLASELNKIHNEDLTKVAPLSVSPSEEDMARTIKIAKTPKKRIDPNKIKKPRCPIHPETQMEYHQVRGKWICNVPNCDQVATPKAEADDNAVVFGKGQVQARLMYTTDGSPHLILIADNNVAIDITDMVDVSAVEAEFEVKSTAKMSTARTEFHIPMNGQVTFNSTLYVMGSDNIR